MLDVALRLKADRAMRRRHAAIQEVDPSPQPRTQPSDHILPSTHMLPWGTLVEDIEMFGS